jgi:hypothetical protein
VTKIEQRRKLLAEATPGPWWHRFEDGSGEGYIVAQNRAEGPVVVGGATDDWGVRQGVRLMPDAALIVAAVNDYAALLEIAEAAGAFLCSGGKDGRLITLLAKFVGQP